MKPVRLDEMTATTQESSDRYAKLILKLRWIGLEDEARRLQQALRTLPPEDRATVSMGPFSTD